MLVIVPSHSCSAASSSLQPHGLYPRQAPLSAEFSRQEYWSGLPSPPPGDLPDPGIEPSSPVLSPALEGIFFFFFFLTTEPSRSYRKVSFLLSTQDFFHFTNKMNQSQEDGSRILKWKRTLSKYFVLFPYLYASASKIPNMKPGLLFLRRPPRRRVFYC